MEMAAAAPKWTKAHWTLVGIILTPMLVVLLATVIFFTGWAMPEGTRNQGVLLTSPVDLSAELGIKKQTEFFGKQQLNPWRFAVAIPNDCDKSCSDKLWFVRQVRTALGKYQGRIENIALTQTTSASTSLPADYQPMRSFLLNEHVFNSLQRRHTLPAAEVMFYLIDPQGLAVMVYSRDHSYQQVIKDMKFLFKGVE